MTFSFTGKQLKEFLTTYKEIMTPEHLISDESLSELRKFRKIMIEEMRTGKSPKEAMGLSNHLLESIYTHAIESYYAGVKDKALLYLRVLTLIDPTNPKYSLALGMVLQLTKAFQQAVFAYALSTAQDPTNPIPWFHMGDCYHELNVEEKTIFSLKKAIELGKDHPKYQKLVNQSQLLLRKWNSYKTP